MRIVKLSDLNEKERKKILEEQELRYKTNIIKAREIENNNLKKYSNVSANTSKEIFNINNNKFVNTSGDFNLLLKNALNDTGNILSNFGLAIKPWFNNLTDALGRNLLSGPKNAEKMINENFINNSSISNEGKQKYIDNKKQMESNVNENIKNIFGVDLEYEQNKKKATRKAEQEEYNRKVVENIENTSNPVARKMAELAPAVGNMVPSMALSVINPLLGTASFISSAQGAYYNEGINRGMSEEESENYGNIMGLIEGGTEALTVGRVFKGVKAMSSGAVKTALKNFGIGMGENAIQEAIIEPISETTAYAVGGKDTADFSNMGSRMLEAGINGALVYMFLGGAGAGLGKVTNVVNNLKSDKHVSEIEVTEAIKEMKDNGINVDNLFIAGVKNFTTSKTFQNNAMKSYVTEQQIGQLSNPVDNLSAIISERIEDISKQKEINNENSYKYEASDNVKIDNFRKDLTRVALDNEKTKSFANIVEKVITDKKYNVRLDENLDTNINGKITKLGNGEIEIKINPNSNRAGEFLLMHEVTHGIETQEIKDLVLDYASKNVEFNQALEDLKRIYKSDEVNDEVVADISAKLFGTQEFIDNLSTQKPTVFKRIYDKIIEIANKITGNSKETLFIKDLKNKWAKAYRTQYNNMSITSENARHSLSNDTELITNIERATSNRKSRGKTELGRVHRNEINAIKELYDIDVSGRKHVLSDNDIRHILKEHGNAEIEATKGQIAVTKDDIKNIPDIIKNPTSIVRGNTNKMGETIRYIREYADNITYVVEVIPNDSDSLIIKTMWKKPSSLANSNEIAPSSTSKTEGSYGSTTSDNILPSNTENVNQEATNKDNQGRTLSKEQQEYFKDSKVRDEKGNLLEVYHGTPYEFNKFNYDKLGENTSSLGSGFYFTDKKITAEEYKRDGGKVKEVYLDIQKPLSYGKTTMTKSEYKQFIIEVNKATNGIYLEDYGGINEALMEYEYGGDDIDLVSAVHIASGLNYEKTFEILRKTTGFDGIISDKGFLNNDETLYIAFNSNQIKNTDNVNPTSNSDIRYSKYNLKWQEYLEKNFKSNGTQTNFKDIIKERQIAPVKRNRPQRNRAIAPVRSDVKQNNENKLNEEKVANLLETKPPSEKESAKEIKDRVVREIVHQGEAVDRLARKTKNPELTYKYDKMGSVMAEGHYAISVAQTDNEGNKIGKSVFDIWKPALDSKLEQLFGEYLLHKHNISRMSLENNAQTQITEIKDGVLKDYNINNIYKLAKTEIDKNTTNKEKELINSARKYIKLAQVKNKPVFADSVTAEISEKYVKETEKRYPQFKEWSKDIQTYNKNQLRNMREAGLTSAEMESLLNETYDNYVRIHRNVNGQLPIQSNTAGLKVNAPIKRAKGSNKDILPLMDSMAQQTLEIKKAIRTNQFGLELMNTLKNGEVLQEYEHSFVNPSTKEIVKQEKVTENKETGKYYFTVFDNGQAKRVEINKGIYEALKPREIKDPVALAPVRAISKVQRELTTAKNIWFIGTNFFKDIGDAPFNSKYGYSFVKNYPKAIQEMYKNGELWNKYKALGGEQTTFFDYQEKLKLPTQNKNILEKIEQVNYFVEQAPRFTEFITSLEKGSSYTEAMYNSADITVNFKRGGNITKALNRNGWTYLNASVQGFDKLYRNISGQNGFRGYVNLLSKALIFGVVPSVLNYLLLSDDEDYKELPNYVKDTYYLFKTSNGQFIRIPKGRSMSLFGMAAVRILEATKGEEDAFKGMIGQMIRQSSPVNSLTSNFIVPNALAPIVQVATNKAWHGSEIVNKSLQNMPAEYQYDEKTDEISKFFGKVFNLSPKKVNYIIDQYSGGLGDTILPLLTPQANKGPIATKFTVESSLSNKNPQLFFEKKEEITKLSNSPNATEEQKLQLKYLNSVQAKLNDLYSEKREVQSSNLSNKDKLQQVKEISQKINVISKSALEDYEDVQKKSNYSLVGEKEFYKNLEAEWVSVSEKEATELNELGMTIEGKNAYFKTKNEISKIVNSTKEAKGQITIDDEDSEEYKNAVSNLSSEKKNNIVNKIIDSGLNGEEKAYLYKKYYNSDTVDTMLKANIDVDEYLTYSTKEFESDYNSAGKAITNSRKNKVINYINSLNMSIPKKAIMIKSTNSFKFNEYNDEIVKYVSDLNLSYKEKVKMLEDLDMTD